MSKNKMPLLTRTPYIPPPYEEMKDCLIEGTTEARYNSSVANVKTLSGMAVSSITYESDGLKITGIEVLPELQPNEKIPLMIYCRGGSGDYGRLSPGQITVLIAPFVGRMRVGVLASNYRGNGGSDGADAFGGADVRDVLRLIEIGQAQEWWDGKNLFILGWSRGGMMTYLTLKAGTPVNAAVIGAGAADLIAGAKFRPAMMERVYKRYIPDFATRGEDALRERSAVYWPEKIHAPLLLLHGDADDRVDVNDAREMAAKLQALGRNVRYVEYPGGDHGLRKQWAEWTQEAVDWFTAHRVDLCRPKRTYL